MIKATCINTYLKFLVANILVCLLTTIALGQDFGDRYRVIDEYIINTKLLKTQEDLHLFVELDIVNKRLQVTNFSFDIFESKGYQEKINQYQPLVKDSIYLSGNKTKHSFKFNIRPGADSPLLVLMVTSPTDVKQHYFDIPLHTIEPVLLTHNGKAHLKSFADSARYITDVNQSFVYYYNYDFPPGQPPMVTKEQIAGKTLTISSFFKATDTLVLNSEGLYLFQTDTTSIKSTTVLIKNKYFPKFTTINELVEPLMYITSKNEIEALMEINGDKKLFDKFWLKLTNSADRAKSIIRVYYERIEQANLLFTSFKEGWKTDMGMIYAVMGAPDYVEKTMNEETWVYLGTRNLPRRKYTFIRSETVFSSNYYVLIREKKHAEAWFEAIDLLRKGIFK